MSILIALLLLELYSPDIKYDFIDISPDFLLILIVLLTFKSGRKNGTLIGFFVGLSKDLLTQYATFGFLSLIGSCFGYAIGSINYIKNTNMKYILVSVIVFGYFFIFYNLQYSSDYIFSLKFSFLKCIMTILSLLSLKIIFKKKITTFEK